MNAKVWNIPGPRVTDAKISSRENTEDETISRQKFKITKVLVIYG